jgi:RNA polymerase sigma factor (sigma-70 family)
VVARVWESARDRRFRENGGTLVRIGDDRTLPDVSAAEVDRAPFAAMFHDLSPRVFAYVRRQCDFATAQDVVADTFLVAWRRWSELPDSPLPWLLVVARNTIANRSRRERRQYRLTETVARLERVAGPAAGADQGVLERETMFTALANLTELEREALLLVAWDGLANHDAAGVAGCSVRAFEVRLSRARARLARAMRDSSSQSGGPALTPTRHEIPSDAALRKDT